jgi:hypothetical protein
LDSTLNLKKTEFVSKVLSPNDTIFVYLLDEDDHVVYWRGKIKNFRNRSDKSGQFITLTTDHTVVEKGNDTSHVLLELHIDDANAPINRPKVVKKSKFEI